MNNKGSVVIYGLMLGLVIIILALALAPAVSQFTGSAMNNTLIIDSYTPTTITLQDADTENFEDAAVYENAATTNYGTDVSLYVYSFPAGDRRSYLKFNISEAEPHEENISSAKLCGYKWVSSATADSIRAYHVTNHTWEESTLTWNNQPCGTAFDNSTFCNLTASDTGDSGTTSGYWVCLDVTKAITTELADSDNNVSFALRGLEDGTRNAFYHYSKEYTGNTALRPTLNITYNTINYITEGLDCDNDSISSFDKAACVATDLTLFYFIAGLIFIAGAIVTSRVIFG